MSSDKLSVILTSVPSKEVAEEISNTIVSEDLAACVQIVPSHISIYKWEGKIQKTQEYLALIKTFKIKEKNIYEIIKKYHDYDIPEILTLKVENVEKNYRKWASGEFSR